MNSRDMMTVIKSILCEGELRKVTVTRGNKYWSLDFEYVNDIDGISQVYPSDAIELVDYFIANKQVDISIQ